MGSGGSQCRAVICLGISLQTLRKRQAVRTCKIIAIVIGAVATDIEYKGGIMKRVIMMFMIIALTTIIVYRANINISKTYKVYENNYEYEVVIRQYNGKVIVSENTYNMEPIIKEVGKDTLMLKVGKGDWHITRFINVKEGTISEGFGNAEAFDSNKVVYPIYEDDTIKIVIQDIYDKDKYYREVIRDYTPVAVPKSMIIDIEFIDDSKLLLKYYSGEEWKEVSEIIEL